VAAAVVISFTEAISPATFSFASMPDPGGWSLAWEENEQAVRMSHLPFADNTLVTMALLEGQDSAGNELVAFSWSFMTAMKVETVYFPVISCRRIGFCDYQPGRDMR
jgi:hypothetical protein